MLDALKLLGSLVENRSAPSAANRFGTAVQQGAASGPLQQLLSQVGGGGGAQQPGLASMLGGFMPQGASQGGMQAPAQGGLAGLLGGFADMARQAARSPSQEIRNNNPAAVGGLGALTGALLDGGRGAMGGGLLAVLGSLAYSALQGQGAGAGAAAMPAAAGGATPLPATEADAQRRAMLVIRAMIQAAKADGEIDPQEVQRIMGKLGEHGHNPEARDFITHEMRKPIDIQALVQDVRTPQEAAEIYAASLLAIELDSQAEQDYLADLAAALRLPQPAVAQLRSGLGVRV